MLCSPIVFLAVILAWSAARAKRVTAVVYAHPGCVFGDLSWDLTLPLGQCVAVGNASMRLDLTHPRGCSTGGDCVVRSYSGALCHPDTLVSAASVPLNHRCTPVILGTSLLAVRAGCRGSPAVATDKPLVVFEALTSEPVPAVCECWVSPYALGAVGIAVAVLVARLRRPYHGWHTAVVVLTGWRRWLDPRQQVEDRLPGP